MKVRAWVLGIVIAGASSYGVVRADQDLSAQQAAAKKARAELQQRIGTLQKHIESTQSDKKDVATALRDVESRISATDKDLNDLRQRQQLVEKQVAELGQQIAQQQEKQTQGQKQLAEQLRAQYASGLSPWTALLSGNNPQQIQRELGYLGYVSKAQADQVRALQQGVKRLEQLHAAEKANQTELVQLATATAKQKQQLQTQQAERQTVLAKIEDQLQTQQKEAGTLASNDARLGKLISGLEKEIAHQAELRRQAEARRKAEEARKQAEEAKRLAAEQQRIAEEQKIAAAREAEEKRLYALAHTPAQPALESDSELTPKPVKESAPPPPPPKPVAQPRPAPAAPAAPPPASAELAGLHKGMAPPVRGEIQGRFGTERPEGGPWRGIIFRADAGTPVKAIAAGQVVFSNWMAGFGNLLIIDHGRGYLSVYGHNQSVLKQVGDSVAAGDAVARVGATGGQIEPGVYFEIRQNGQPINPQLWLGS